MKRKTIQNKSSFFITSFYKCSFSVRLINIYPLNFRAIVKHILFIICLNLFKVLTGLAPFSDLLRDIIWMRARGEAAPVVPHYDTVWRYKSPGHSFCAPSLGFRSQPASGCRTEAVSALVCACECLREWRR